MISVDALPEPGLIDVAAMTLMALATLRGFFRGLSRELAGLVSLAVVLVLGVRLYPVAGAWMSGHSQLTGRAAEAAAFILLVLVGMALLWLVRWLLGALVRVVVEPRVDRPLGAVAGALRGALLVLMLTLAAVLVPHERLNTAVVRQSWIGAWVERSLPRLQELVERVGDGAGEANAALPGVEAR